MCKKRELVYFLRKLLQCQSSFFEKVICDAGDDFYGFFDDGCLVVGFGITEIDLTGVFPFGDGEIHAGRGGRIKPEFAFRENGNSKAGRGKFMCDRIGTDLKPDIWLYFV